MNYTLEKAYGMSGSIFRKNGREGSPREYRVASYFADRNTCFGFSRPAEIEAGRLRLCSEIPGS